MARSESKQQRLHALAIPMPAQGHINPLMRFCKMLASQEGFTITFVDIDIVAGPSPEELKKQENASRLQAISAAAAPLHKPKHESIHGDDNSLSQSQQKLMHTGMDAKPSDGLQAVVEAEADDVVAEEKLDIRRVHIPLEVPKPGKGTSIFAAITQALESLPPVLEELLCRLIHQEPPVTCLISDIYATSFTQKVAGKFGIPRIAVHTTSQSLLVFKNYVLEGTISLDQVLDVVTRKEAPKDDIFVEGLPGLPTLRNGDLMDYLVDNVLFYEVNLKVLKETKERAHALVVNCIKELEEPGFTVNIGSLPLYAVGPLIEPLDKDTSTSLWKEDKDCILWLNEQPHRSVLYISFGSFAILSKAQFDEFIAGLLSSGQRFLWVFRPNLVPDVSYSTLHSDMLSQSHGRGYVVEWAPQITVLSHPSVGGFFTHCGWNSTIEAITLGVPMLCFPYMSDQFINAMLITREWKVGLGFKTCKESGIIEREEVEKVIRALMVEEEGELLQRNAKTFKEISHRNLLPESTSAKNIKALVDSLR